MVHEIVPAEGDLETKEWSDSDIQQVSPAGGRIPNVYVNNARVGYTNWDAWIQFGSIIGQDQNKLLIEPKVRVTMSLQHMKAFVTAIQGSLAQFEAQFGEIQILAIKTTDDKNE